MNGNDLDSFKSTYRYIADKLKSLSLKDLLSAIAIVLSLGTIHFAFFVESFDARMLAIVDSSAVSGYFLFLTFVIVVSAVIARFFVYVTISMLRIPPEPKPGKSMRDGFLDRVRFSILMVAETWEAPYGVALLLFTVIFTGPYMFAHLALIAALLFAIVLFRNARLLHRFTRNEKMISKSVKSSVLLWKKPRRRLYSVLRPDEPWGIVIMIALVSFVASARAEFVKNRHVFCVIQAEDLEPSENVCKASIFLSAQNGIFVWDQDRSVALFIPWASGITVEAVEPRRGFLGRPGAIIRGF